MGKKNSHDSYASVSTGEQNLEAQPEDAGRLNFDCVLLWKYDRFVRSLGLILADDGKFLTRLTCTKSAQERSFPF